MKWTKATKRIGFALVTVAGLTLATVAAAQEPPSAGERGGRLGRFPGPGSEHSGHSGHFEGPFDELGFGRLLAVLDLDDSQRDEIKALVEGHRAANEATHEQIRDLAGELETLVQDDPYNEGAIRAKARELADLRVEMAVVRARLSGDVRALLTPEQLEMLAEHKSMRKEFRQERHNRWRGRN